LKVVPLPGVLYTRMAPRVCADVRKLTGLRRPARGKRLPRILPDEALRRFYETVERAGNLQHEIMLKLLFYTSVRVGELTSIEVTDVDVDGGKIFISEGKGDKDRYILFPDSFRLILKTHLAAHPENRFLFESRQRTKYSTRRVQQIVSQYGDAAGIEQHVHPHLFRHQMLSWLTAQGLPDAQIQLISGHASKKSLEVYQHLSLASVKPAYQRAVKELEV
jgi:integrase/recombinase XerD